MPPGYRLEWTGSFENQQRAVRRLAVVVPITLLAIFFLLFTAFDSGRFAALILLNVPFAAIGGILALPRRPHPFGLRPRRVHRAVRSFGAERRPAGGADPRAATRRRAVRDAVRQGSLSRMRQIVMTAAMAALGLLPAALSHGVGAETARPFAVVIIGGLISATVLTLLVLPVLYGYFEREADLLR